MGCLGFLETANQKTLFILCIILLVFGALNFFTSEDFIIGLVIGVATCFLAFLGIVGAWRKDTKFLVMYMVGCGFVLLLQLVGLAFQTMEEEPSFTAMIFSCVQIVYYCACFFFAWRIHRQTGHQIII